MEAAYFNAVVVSCQPTLLTRETEIFGSDTRAPVGDTWNSSSMAFETLTSLVNRHAEL